MSQPLLLHRMCCMAAAGADNDFTAFTASPTTPQLPSSHSTCSRWQQAYDATSGLYYYYNEEQQVLYTSTTMQGCNSDHDPKHTQYTERAVLFVVYFP